MLQLSHIEVNFSGRRIFADISWHLKPGQRVGLCGENGAGKSTLLKLLCGQVEADRGDLVLARGTSIGYLPQDGLTYRGRSLYAEVESACAEVLALGREMAELEQRIAGDADEAALARYAEVQERHRQLGGFSLEADIARVLHGLGFSRSDWDKPCEQFSGGWQMRIALARLLLQRPNLLLLDEPTNHLDLPARDWLESYLIGYPGSVVLVSHDRFFMDQVVQRIVELWNGGLTEYPGNYSLYLQERDRRVDALRAAKQQQDEEIERLEAFINRFRYQANKAAQVQSRVRQLDKIERIQIPPQRKKIAFRFPSAPRSGKELIVLEQVAQRYADLQVFSGVDLTISRGERVALVGANGAGKSTLMRLLCGVEAPAQGCCRLGHQVELAYFAQDQAQVLNPANTVLQEITAAAPVAMVPRLRDVLGSFLFSGDDVHKSVAVLSGGERNRLALAILLLRPANLLLLDEPTNHLDLASKEVLLDALRHYSGTLVFVSHDRYFVDSLATRVLEVADGRVTSWPGNYEDFLRAKQALGQGGHAQLRVESCAVAANGRPGEDKQARMEEHARRREQVKQQRRLQKELEQIEGRIGELETRRDGLERELADPALYAEPAAFNARSADYAAVDAELTAAYAEWEELQHQVEGLEEAS
ncbi:ABC-F family ATP-binding cassette domain-containing protein [Desulfuromonas thiophila]|uniref:ABC-F family ATP-binding cassette domain-containing protein n=1 Tax=Desulfuromonas thiophila TaxID=57664 RepID=UPI0029F4C43D|nr:ABC-F family ATP-binding cassette domain-containing protein [Desulfuromonas thiophila]